MHREGTDLTIITYGRMLPMCLEAAAELHANQGISVEVVDPRTLVPLDKETIIASAKKTGRVLIVHEACQTGGFGGELAAVIAESDAFYRLKAPIRRYGGLDVPIPYSPGLEARAVPDKDGVIQRLWSWYAHSDLNHNRCGITINIRGNAMARYYLGWITAAARPRQRCIPRTAARLP